jgi:hypothetical protein
MNFIYFLRMKRAGSIIPYERLYRTGTLPGTGTVLVLYLVCTGSGSAMAFKKNQLADVFACLLPKTQRKCLVSQRMSPRLTLGNSSFRVGCGSNKMYVISPSESTTSLVESRNVRQKGHAAE